MLPQGKSQRFLGLARYVPPMLGYMARHESTMPLAYSSLVLLSAKRTDRQPATARYWGSSGRARRA